MFLKDKKAHIDIDICNLFSEHFAISHKHHEPLYFDFVLDDLILDLEITELEISSALNTLKR